MLDHESLLARTQHQLKLSKSQPSMCFTWSAWFWPSVFAYQSLGFFYTMRFLKKKYSKIQFIKITAKMLLKAFFGKTIKLLLPNDYTDKNSILVTWATENQIPLALSGHDVYFGKHSEKELNEIFRIYCLVGPVASDKIQDLIAKGFAVMTWEFDWLRPFKAIMILLQALINKRIAFKDIFYFIEPHFIDAEILGPKFETLLSQMPYLKNFFLPYEGQPFQQKLLDCCHKRAYISTFGYLHTTFPPCPGEMTFTPVAPKYLLVHGNANASILNEFLGWPKERIHSIDSYRYTNNHSLESKIYLPNSLMNFKQILNEFNSVLDSLTEKIQPLKIGLHPGRVFDPEHINYAKQIEALLSQHTNKFDILGKKCCFLIGVSTILFEALEQDYTVYNIICDPEIEIYHPKIFKSLTFEKVTQRCLVYHLKNKSDFIRYPSGQRKNLLSTLEAVKTLPTKKKLSIIVPYYKVRHDWLIDCLNSIKLATSRRDEIETHVLIIDDCSPTSLPDLTDFFKNSPKNINFRIIHNEKNLGLAGARNVGLNLTPFDHYIHFLDGDDLCGSLPDLQADFDIIIGNHLLFSSNATPSLDYTCQDIIKKNDHRKFYNKLLLRNMNPVSAYFIRRSVIGDLKFREDLTSCEDWGFWIDLFHQICTQKKEIIFGKTPLIVNAVRKSQGSMSSSFERIYQNRSKLFCTLNQKGAFYRSIAKSNIFLGQCYFPKNHSELFFSQIKMFITILKLFIIGPMTVKITSNYINHILLCLATAFHPNGAKKYIIARFKSRC